MGNAAESVTYKGKKYKRTKPKDWMFLMFFSGEDIKSGLGEKPRTIDALPFNDPENEVASVKITCEKIETLKDVDAII